MATSVVPALLKALRTQAASALPGRIVSLGTGVTDDPGTYLMVGVDDPDSERPAAAEADAEWRGLGAHARDQTGGLWCRAYAWNGDADAVAALDAVYAVLAAVEALVVTDPTLGVISSGWCTPVQRERLSQAQGDWGAEAVLDFQLAFKARI